VPALATPGLVTALSAAVTSSLPLLLLDVDGVLNPFAAPACPPGYTEHDLFPGEEPVRLCAAHGPWLQELATRFQIVWATAWGADANQLLAPLLQLPDLPVIRFPPVPFHPRDKLPAIIRFARHRPLTWIDDALPPGAHAWAATRRAPTLLIGIDPAEGLTRPVIEQSLQWADDHHRNDQRKAAQLRAWKRGN
jgi:HAD domain in Swiss Army Knife RNA repair proteins